MASNLNPSADFSDLDHDDWHECADFSDLDHDDWHECADCGGSGEDDSMCQCEHIEDICCCAVPTPARCDTCRGKGGWHLGHSAEDQALHEADNESS